MTIPAHPTEASATDLKECLSCGLKLPLRDYARRTGIADGYQARCKSCEKLRRTERETHRQEERATDTGRCASGPACYHVTDLGLERPVKLPKSSTSAYCSACARHDRHEREKPEYMSYVWKRGESGQKRRSA